MRVVLRRALNYYGSKLMAAKHYPSPVYTRIVEPFAGGAGYALNYLEYDVELYDKNPDVILAWQYLISTPGSEILKLPLMAIGDKVPGGLEPGAAMLIRWNVNMVQASPRLTLIPSAAVAPTSFWGEGKRKGLAELADRITHWKAQVCDYRDLDTDEEATWFVDPPYCGPVGDAYPHRFVDYDHLSSWCRSLTGQVIVCESPGATWLPFEKHHVHTSAPTSDVVGRRTTHECVWIGPEVV